MNRAQREIDPVEKQRVRQQIEAELLGNILPFWVEKTPDEENGGFYGALTNELEILNDRPRAAVLLARILWTFSLAYRTYGKPEYLTTARRAYDYLTQTFWDAEFGGVYWQVDKRGAPLDDRKYTYAQSFAIYGLTEYYAATGEAASLARAQELFDLLEAHAHDDKNGGYREGGSRDWAAKIDMRLGPQDLNTTKSMNTLLHALEALLNLSRVWDSAQVRLRLRELVLAFLEHVIDPNSHHFRLYFDDEWRASGDEESYGHDMEGSWLLVEAAEALGDAFLVARTRAVAVKMAQAVYAHGLDSDNSVLYDHPRSGPRSFDRHRWVEAESMVGFYNAYEITNDVSYAREALDLWSFIAANFVDHEHGDWFKRLNRSGVPYNRLKVGPWECPYHHARACFAMIRRLA